MAVPKFQRGPEVGPVPRPGALEIEPYVPGSSREQRTPRTVILSSNESALGASPAAVAAYERGSHALHRYPDAASTELRDALAVAHGVDAAQIVCGDGSDELLHLLALGYAGPGDDVLFSEHGFVVYPMATHAVGARPRSVPERGYTVDVDAMIEAVTPEEIALSVLADIVRERRLGSLAEAPRIEDVLEEISGEAPSLS